MATPTITFQVNLNTLSSEVIGQGEAQRSQGVLSPDRFQSCQNTAIADLAIRAALREAYIPGDFAADNYTLSQGQTFSATGKNALYLRNTYGIGYATDPSRAILTVVSVTN